MEAVIAEPPSYTTVLDEGGDDVPRLLEAAVRAWREAGPDDYPGTAELIETMSNSMTDAEVLALHAPPELNDRVEVLLAINRNSKWSADEEREWRAYEFIEVVGRRAKALTRAKLRSAS